MTTKLKDLPTRIRSISNPRWTDSLRWTPIYQAQGDSAMAEVDHDWRIWVALPSGKTTVRNKGEAVGRQFDTLAEGLESLDYTEW